MILESVDAVPPAKRFSTQSPAWTPPPPPRIGILKSTCLGPTCWRTIAVVLFFAMRTGREGGTPREECVQSGISSQFESLRPKSESSNCNASTAGKN